MAGFWAMCARPSAASTPNHSVITGPKKRPTLAVPKRCTANRSVITAKVMGTIHW
jgi:hypothetical protein